jgi:hypothetical protein
MPSPKCKDPANVTAFARIAAGSKSALVILESGTFDAETDVEQFIDVPGIIPDLNGHHGAHHWNHMHEITSVHIATMEYLTTMVNVVPNWPPESAGTNPIESLWSILGKRVGDVRPQTKKQVIELIRAA